MLHVNLDETSLKLHVPPRHGYVVERCPKRRRRLLRGGQGGDLKSRRAAVTLIAFACDDETVQKLLPQIFLVNEHVVTKADVAELRSRCQDRVLISRRRSSWVNAATMVEVVKVLAACLESLQGYHVVLHMDVCPSHTHASVLQACSDANFFVHFIPACTTFCLQPLDVAVFCKLKSWVSHAVERRRLESPAGLVTRADTLEIWRRGVDEVIRSQGWRQAFEQCGLLGQGNLSASLASRLDFCSWSPIGDGLPSLADLQAVFPANRCAQLELLFQSVLKKEKLAHIVRIPRRARLP